MSSKMNNAMRIDDIKKMNLKVILDRRGMNVPELARILEVKKPYAYALLYPSGRKGSRNIGSEMMKKLCEKLNVHESEFYKGIEIINIDSIDKSRNLDELIRYYVSMLNEEDKKTVLRLIIRLLNPPKLAVVVMKEIISNMSISPEAK
jgi:transcriptional regulator with XRE-family HTH domain